MRDFPFGKAVFVIIVLAVLSGLWIALHPLPQKKSTLVMWTFAKNHYDAYKKAIPSFEAAHPGVSVDVQLVDRTAVASRLQAAFLANLDVPDLVEVEISTAGSFFRGPLKDVGFADLTDRVHSSGLSDRMLAARFSPYMSRGRIFGLPHDVHPVQLAYRRDLLEKAGVDVNKIKTWDDFIRIGRKLTVFGSRYMIELSDSDPLNLEVMLYQRGGGYFDKNGKCIMDNDIAAKTMCWYVPLVAGDKRISGNLGSGQILTKAVEDGYFLCMLCPDWRTKLLEMDIPRVKGKMALMPLPSIAPGGISTSTTGGTMLGITKHCKKQKLAWQLAMHLYTDQSELADRFRGTNIIPALRDAWRQPEFHESRPYWSGQAIGDSYAKLAPEVPLQYTSPFIVTAKQKMGEALVACVQRYKDKGDKGFEQYVRIRLKQSADEVRAMMERSPY